MNQTPIIVNNISIFVVRPMQGLLGFASCNISIGDWHFSIGDLSIRSRPDGELRILYPQKSLVTGARINCFVPLNTVTAQAIEKPILDKFTEIMTKAIEKKVNTEMNNGNSTKR